MYNYKNYELKLPIRFSELHLYVNKNIYERGSDYYAEGRVIAVKKISNNEYEAPIKGGEIYYTTIVYVHGNQIVDYFCSCPCKFFCKHTVALLCHLMDNFKFKPLKKLLVLNADAEWVMESNRWLEASMKESHTGSSDKWYNRGIGALSEVKNERSIPEFIKSKNRKLLIMASR